MAAGGEGLRRPGRRRHALPVQRLILARRSSAPPRGSAIAVGLLALVLYLPSLSNGFAFDDVQDVRDNPAVVDAKTPVDVLTSPYRGSVPPQRSPYRPVTTLSYWLDRGVGDSALSFHTVNVALHAVASALVVCLLASLGASAAGAWVGGLLFAVHPVHVEAVANIVGRADVMMAVFCLVGALVFLDSRLGAAARAVGVSVAYALALGSKENGVVLPGVLGLVSLFAALPGDDPEARRARFRRDLLVLAPTLLVLAGYLLLRRSVLGTIVHADTAPYIAALPPSERVMTAVANLGHLVRLLVLPADLSADYGPNVIVVATARSVRFWVGVLVAVLAVASVALLHRRREPLGALAVCWVACTFLVVGNLILPIGVWIAERTLYLPSVGVALGAAAVVGWIERRRPDAWRAVVPATGLLLVAGGWRTLDRIPAWRDTDTFFATIAKEHPESYRAQWWLAERAAAAGDLAGALRGYGSAVRASPNDLGLTLDYARALLLAGRSAEAEAILAPLPPIHPSVFVYLAQSEIMAGRQDEARAHVRNGLARFPGEARLLGQARELGLAESP